MSKRRSPEPISAIEDRLLRASVALGDYLARKPMGSDSAFIRASAIFARDGAATGELKAFSGEELAAIVWGPLSALLRNHACSVESLKQLEQAAWDGLRRI
jgi:hypothetical protein